MGADTADILKSWLSLSAAEIDNFAASDVVGVRTI
jgi:hypothetical protein